MRAILIDWLVEVHMKFHLVPETLYLGVNILDRYLSIVEVGRNQLQLLGVTALFVASKYEEIYPPEVRDCVYITDRGYTRQQVLDMETNILNTLEFNMSVPTAHPFMQRFLFITKATETMTHASNFYLERVLQEEEFLVFRPSLVAAAAVCLAINHPELREADMLPEDERPGVVRILLCFFDRCDACFLNHRANSFFPLAFTARYSPRIHAVFPRGDHSRRRLDRLQGQ